jgi:(E)-4-hydroxy-3-methylbut-2-enyl-diphosphate synthase
VATCFPCSPETYSDSAIKSEKLNLILTGPHYNKTLLNKLDPSTSLLIFTFDPEKDRYSPEKLFASLTESGSPLNVILNPVFSENDPEELMVKASAILGVYLTDSRISGISVTNRGQMLFREINRLCFSILQCTETRITRTIYLSCPTCGRTKFNLQEAVRKTGHLKGLKIAVMGCIVNGPGEMAGADWGYVGAADGKVHIYKGTVPVLKNIPEENAADELLRMIKEDL